MRKQEHNQRTRYRVAAFLGLTAVIVLLALMMGQAQAAPAAAPAANQNAPGNQVVHDNGAPWGAVIAYRGHENVPSDIAAGQVAGDDFTLAQQTTISEITWFGLYGTTYGDPLDLFSGGFFLDAPAGGTTLGYQDQFTLAIYKVAAGVPEADPLITWNVGDVPEEPWFTFISGLQPSDNDYVRAGYFRYKVDIPYADRITLDPGEYLLTIYNDHPKGCIYVTGRQCTLYPTNNQPQAWEWADSINTDTIFYPTPSSFKSTNPGAGGQANWQTVPDRELSWFLTDNAVSGAAEPYTYYDMWQNPYRIDYQAVGSELYDVDYVCSTSGRIFTNQPWTKMAFYQDPGGAADASLAINAHLSQNRPTSNEEITTVSFIRYRRYCQSNTGWDNAKASKYYVPFEQPFLDIAVGWQNVDPLECNALYSERRWCNPSGTGGIDAFDQPGPIASDPKTGDPTFAYLRKSHFVPDLPGTIQIKKSTFPGGGTGFSFSDDIAAPNSFLLDDGQTQTFSDVKAGVYTVTEDDPSASSYELSGLTCTDNNSTVDIPARTATIRLEPGETVICTFTNLVPDSIVIHKETVPGTGSGFNFTDNIAGPNHSFILDGGQSEAFHNVTPGTYTITEEDPSTGFYLADIVCGGSFKSQDIDLNQRTVTLTMDPGQTAHCTFRNVQPGRIIVDKVIYPSGELQKFPFVLSGGPENVNQNFALAEGDTPHDSGLVKAGSYSVVEGNVSGWVLGSAVCSDGSDPANIDLDFGETVHCTFTNLELDSIVIHKETVPGTGSGFKFTDNITGPNHNFTLDDGKSEVFHDVKPGTYTITEEDPSPGFFLADIVCGGSFKSTDIDLDQRSVTLTMDPGQTAHCTFRNQESHKYYFPIHPMK